MSNTYMDAGLWSNQLYFLDLPATSKDDLLGHLTLCKSRARQTSDQMCLTLKASNVAFFGGVFLAGSA